MPAEAMEKLQNVCQGGHQARTDDLHRRAPGIEGIGLLEQPLFDQPLDSQVLRLDPLGVAVVLVAELAQAWATFCQRPARSAAIFAWNAAALLSRL